MEIPALEIPNSDEWWDTNNGRCVNKKDLSFKPTRGSTNRSVNHLAFYDKFIIENGNITEGKMWELIPLDSPFSVGPGQTAVLRAGSLTIFGYNPASLTMF
jgi:hypothetical protein